MCGRRCYGERIFVSGLRQRLSHPEYTLHRIIITYKLTCFHLSLFTIHYSPFTIHHSPFTIHHSPFTFHLSPSHRVTCIGEMHFGADGKILPVKLTNEGVHLQKPGHQII
ncbi:hypothetical protein EGI32_15620 [Ferruginibacter sp. HRS2-29]|nr:hypothetical protein [Ferruginibacter sp. HRS2-29]